jgi:hypothetical protein
MDRRPRARGARRAQPGSDPREARENVLDALRTVLTPDEELQGQHVDADREYLRFVAAA